MIKKTKTKKNKTKNYEKYFTKLVKSTSFFTNIYQTSFKKGKIFKKTTRLLRYVILSLAIFYFALGNFGPVYAQVLEQTIYNATKSAILGPLPIPQLQKPFGGDFPVSRIYGDTTLDQQDSDFGRALSKAEGQNGNNGLDFAMPDGTPLLAVDDGQVIQAGNGDYGLDVIIKHSWGKSVYGHLSELGSFNPTPGFLQSGDQRKLQMGDTVKKGDIIGWSGHTGLATGPHVHFGLKDSTDNWVDPALYLGLPQYAAQNVNQTATSSAIFAGLQSRVLGIATDSAAVSIPVSPDTSSPTDAYHYKFSLIKGNSAHFWDKQNKRADFAITDDKKNNKLGFTLEQNTATGSATPQLDTNQVLYPVNIASATANLEYTVTDSKVKENIILNEKPDLSSGDLQIAFDVNQTGLTVKSQNGAYEFKSADGVDDWIVQAPTVVDSNGKAGDITASLQNSVYTLHVSQSYLATASYPVTIDPTVIINNSSDLNATQVSTMHHIARTSDGTLHAFVQIGTQTATCGGSSKSGLLWFNSTDSGATWTCQAQLSSNTTQLFYADAEVDGSNNIYVVYSQVATGGGATLSTYYRKLTYTGSTTWTLSTERTVLTGTSTVGYSYANIEIQSTTRLWIAVRYFDGTNYQVSVYDSGDQTDNPSWTLSQTALDTVGTTNTKHIPTMVRFGSSIGVIWSDQTASGLYWRTRGDSDTLTSWVSQIAVFTTAALTTSTFAAATDASGHVYVATNASTSVYLNYFNGSTWTASLVVSATAASAAFVSLATDNDNVWVFYGDTTSLAAGLSGSRKLVYKECYAPFLVAGDCDSASTNINSYQDVFDKVWAFRSTGSVYTDVTTASGNTTTADVINSSSSKMVSTIGDIIYFGKTAQYDSLSWALSTAGVGGTIVWEYCSGVDGSSNCNAWSTLTLAASSTPSFTATTNGYGSFTPPGGWVAGKVNGDASTYYYVRARVSVAFTTAPIGTQVAAIPQINWVSAIPNVVSNTIYLTWNENATSPEKVRYGSATVTGLTPGSDSLLNPLVGYSSANTATQLSTQHHIVKTSDGTLHSFVQGGTLNVCGAGSGTAVGLVWVESTDGGSTWTCQGQLNSSSTIYADARVDGSDNIYVVYSMAANGAAVANDVFYRKITYNGSSSWTLGSEQTVFNGTASIGYAYAALELDGSRVWVAARYFDGVNYQVSVDYSSDQSSSPSWSTSITTLETAGSTATKHIPTMVRFGSNIGVIWSDQTASGLYWRIHNDSDGLTGWTSQEAVFTTAALTTATFAAATDASGHVYVATNASTSVYLNYFNGSTWTASLVVSAVAANAVFVSLSTDGNNVWVFYGDTTNLSASLTGARKLVYKKCTPPFLNTADCDTNSTNITSSQDVYDKVWQFVTSGSVYTDKTTAAGNSTTADVAMVSAVGDTMYFGKTSTFSTAAWVLSTSGTVGVVRWEYYNGTSWVPIPTFITETAQNLTASGYIEFIPMSDWAATSINGEGSSYYYIRARVITAYTIAPIGTQMASIPQINWANALSNVSSNTTPLIWTENANSPWRIRYATVTTTSSSRATAAAIAPTVGFSAVTTASQISSMHHIVQTSDGTLHAFIQSSTTLACGGQGGSNSIGLVWVESTDSGSTWTCQGQLNAAAIYFADARVDSSDNIYVVYSAIANGAAATDNILYRKITYNGGSSWTLGSERTVVSGSASIGYAYATLELDPTHVWVASRYYDGANYQVNVQYSSNQSDNPTWTQSMLALDTAGSTATRHTPTMVRFGTNIGVIWNDQTATGLVWRFRNDTDGLTNWVGQAPVFATGAVSAGLFDAVSDSQGRIYVATTVTTTVYMVYFNGATWMAPLSVSTTASSALFVSLSTDGNNVWVFYGDTTGLAGTLSGGRRLVYKKCAPPFLNATDCDSVGTKVVSYQDTYDQVWQYVASGPTYTDKTTVAGNSTTADVSMVSSVNDAMYFGSTDEFGTVAWVLSTSGTTGVVEWEYYNGSTWKPLTDILLSSTPNFTAATGYMTFIPNSDWATTSVNGVSDYYIRARVITAYGTAPVGTQMGAIPQINWGSALSNVTSNTVPFIWTEDAAAPERVRFSPVSVTSTTRSTTVNISPAIIAYSARAVAIQASGERRIVKTSDGTLHAFVQAATQPGCGSSSGTNTGLVWIMSTDGGNTWTCQGQLNSTAANYTADTEVDSSDNIYVVYSEAGSTAGTQYDIFYRKLTYNGGSSWTLGAEQIAVDNTTASHDYSYATIESEHATRLWIAARYFDGTNYQVTAYYSSDSSDSPTWTQSIATLDTAGTNASYHVPQIVRTNSSEIAIIYNDQATSGDMFWSYRTDGDSLTSWHPVATATNTTALTTATFSAVGDTGGNIYLAINDGTHVYFTYYNGSVWSSAATVSSTASSGNFVSTSFDGSSVYVLYGDTTNLAAGLSGNHTLVYKKGTSPFATGNFDTNPTQVVTQETIFDQSWAYRASDTSYTDVTTAAGNSTTADVKNTGSGKLVNAIGDMIYFGKTTQFDSISWVLSTNGTTGVVEWEYWNGSTWTPITDLLVSATPNFTGNGYISFIPNTDWAATSVNGVSDYYIRARVITAYATAPIGTQAIATPQINWANMIDITGGAYAMWEENAVVPERIRYITISSGSIIPTISQILRHGEWFLNGIRQAFTF